MSKICISHLLAHVKVCLKTHSNVILLQLAAKKCLFTHLGSFQYASLRSLPLPTRNLYFQFQQNKTNGQLNFGIRDLHMTKICTSRRQVSESKLPLMTTDEIFTKCFEIRKLISDILLEYQHESSLESFYGHFDSKGCFSAQILPASSTGLPIKLSCDCRNLAVNTLKFLFHKEN